MVFQGKKADFIKNALKEILWQIFPSVNVLRGTGCIIYIRNKYSIDFLLFFICISFLFKKGMSLKRLKRSVGVSGLGWCFCFLERVSNSN